MAEQPTAKSGVFISRHSITTIAIVCALFAAIIGAFFAGAFLEEECFWFKDKHDRHLKFEIASNDHNRSMGTDNYAHKAFFAKDWNAAIQLFTQAAAIDRQARFSFNASVDFKYPDDYDYGEGLAYYNAAAAADNAGYYDMCIRFALISKNIKGAVIKASDKGEDPASEIIAQAKAKGGKEPPDQAWQNLP